MKIKILFSCLILMVLFSCNGSKTETKNVSNNDTIKKEVVKLLDNVRGSRYCEILIVKGNLTDLVATVYNTLGCNDCDAEKWKSIDIEKLRLEQGAKKIMKNGPRYFLMDKIGQFNEPPPKVNLGGIEMVERARVPLSIEMILDGKIKPYKETTVKRKTEFDFNKGQEEYFLKNGNHTYIMQSYAQIVDPNLTEKDLKELGSKLKLPEGWSYEVKILENDIILKTEEQTEAHILQDDLKNSYQRID